MPESRSNAQELFDRIVNAENPGAYLESMVESEEKTYETEWLEFKRYHNNETDQKETISKAASEFANTGG
jgi:hypothetical protein